MRAAERGLTPDDLAALGRRHERAEWVAAAQLYREYLDVTRLRQATPDAGERFDPAVVVDEAAEALLAWDDEVPRAPRPRWRLVVVDDHQESTAATARLLRVLADDGARVVLLADPDEAVQTFRGATPALVGRAGGTGRGLGELDAETLVLGTVWRQGTALRAVTTAVTQEIGAVAGVRHRRAVSTTSPEVPTGHARVAILPSSAQEAAYVAHALRAAHLEQRGPVGPDGRRRAVRRAGRRSAARTRRGVGPGVRGGQRRPAARGAGRAAAAARAAVRPGPVDPRRRGGDRAADVAVRRCRRGRAAPGATGAACRGAGRRGRARERRPARGDARGPGPHRDAAGHGPARAAAARDPARRGPPGRAGARRDGADRPVGPVVGRRPGRAVAPVGARGRDGGRAGGSRPRRGPRALPGGRDLRRPAAAGAAARVRRLPRVAGPAVGQPGGAVGPAGRPCRCSHRPGPRAASGTSSWWPASRTAPGRTCGCATRCSGPRRWSSCWPGGPPTARWRAPRRGPRCSPTSCARSRSRPPVPAGRCWSPPWRTPTSSRRRSSTSSSRPTTRTSQPATTPTPGSPPRRPPWTCAGWWVPCAPGSRRVRPFPAGSVDREAAALLARLAREGVEGADPAGWYGLAPVTTKAPLWTPDEKVPVSPSKAETVTTCALRWALEAAGGTVADGASQTLGTLVHAIAEALPRGTEAEMLAELDRRWPELGLRPGWPATAERRRAEKMIARLAGYVAAAGEAVLREAPFSVELDRALLRGRGRPGGGRRRRRRADRRPQDRQACAEHVRHGRQPAARQLPAGRHRGGRSRGCRRARGRPARSSSSSPSGRRPRSGPRAPSGRRGRRRAGPAPWSTASRRRWPRPRSPRAPTTCARCARCGRAARSAPRAGRWSSDHARSRDGPVRVEIARLLERDPPTAEQVEIIEAPLEPLLVVAGAGSGKTETMAGRVVWLIANGLVAPHEVLGLTFTRKAAGELGDRVRLRLRRLLRAMPAAGVPLPPAFLAGDGRRGDGAPGGGLDLARPTVSTYNSYAASLVTDHALRLGIEPTSRLLGEAGQWQLAHEVVESWAGDLDTEAATSTVVEAVLSLSGALVEHLRTPARGPRGDRGPRCGDPRDPGRPPEEGAVRRGRHAGPLARGARPDARRRGGVPPAQAASPTRSTSATRSRSPRDWPARWRRWAARSARGTGSSCSTSTRTPRTRSSSCSRRCSAAGTR